MTLNLYERASIAERERDVLEDGVREALELASDHSLPPTYFTMIERLQRCMADVQRIRDEAHRDAADPAREDDGRISEADSVGERGRA